MAKLIVYAYDLGYRVTRRKVTRLGKSRAHYSALDQDKFFYVLITRPSPKAGAELKWARCFVFCILFIIFIIFSRCRESALLRTLIGSRAVCRSRAPDSHFQCELMAKYENYALPGRSVPPQVD